VEIDPVVLDSLGVFLVDLNYFSFTEFAVSKSVCEISLRKKNVCNFSVSILLIVPKKISVYALGMRLWEILGSLVGHWSGNLGSIGKIKAGFCPN
jgi:hypothetical protein